MAGRISMGARREVVSAVAERYRSARRAGKGRILDELCATTGWHRKHAVRALRQRETVTVLGQEAGARRRRYGATIKDAWTALWEASDRVCGKRLKVMIPTLLPPLEQHGGLKLDKTDRDLVLAISAATIDRVLGDVKVAASGGKRRRAGFYSAIRREVPIRTFNDWNSPPPGFCEVDMVAHGGTSVAGSFIQTLTMVDVATRWPECLPLVTRDGALVINAMKHVQRLFPWLLRGVGCDNDTALMNDVVVPCCREQKRTLDPVGLLAEIRAAEEELGNGVDRRGGDARSHQGGGKSAASQPVQSSPPDAVVFARTLGTTVASGEPRATHRRPKRPCKTRIRMPSKLDPHVAMIEDWLAAEPQLTALAIVGRLGEKHPQPFRTRQHSIHQRLLKALRKKAV